MQANDALPFGDDELTAAPSSVPGWLYSLPPVCEVLRDYQRKQVGDIAESLNSGLRRILVQLATGGGKTHELGAMVSAAALAGLPVLIIATRTKLVRQIHERLAAFNVPHGIIAAALPGLIHRNQLVQVASADTLYRRCLVDRKMPLPPACVVVFDEAHLALGASRAAILDSYPQAVQIGFTATPAKTSGRSLASRFERLLLGPTTAELIAAKMLVPARIFAAPVVTTAELKDITKDSKTNDFAVGELGDLMSQPKLIGDVVTNWLRIAAGKRTLVFACNKRHGQHLVEEFSRAGVATEILTDEDDEPTREAAMARLERGETSVIVNCFLLSYGVDLPNLEAIVLARPTRSLVLYLQAVGRGMRPAPSKEFVIVIDHGRVVENLGFPTDNFHWTLDPETNVNARALARQQRRAASEKCRTCPECNHTWLVSEDGSACHVCGWVPAPTAKPILTTDAELAELNSATATAALHSPEVALFFAMAIGWYARQWPDRWSAKPNSGRWWAWSQTRDKFKFSDQLKMPSRFWRMGPVQPTNEVNGFLWSQRIRFSKSKKAKARQAA